MFSRLARVLVSASLLAAALPACAASSADRDGDSAASGTSAFTSRAPQAARLTLGSALTNDHNVPYVFAADSGAESFVMVGDTVTLSVPTYELWPTLYPNAAEPYSDLTREQQLHAVIHVAGYAGARRVSDATVTTHGLRGGDGHTTFSTFTDAPAYTVPAGVDSLQFTVDVSDDSNGNVKTIPYGIAKTTVLGGSLPDKTLFLDEVNGARRERVLEGGELVSGSNIRVVFTDYRADNVVARYSIDRKIGHGRDLGAKNQETDILGSLEHEVAVGYAFDAAWSAETALAPRAPSDFVQGFQRSTFESVLHAPAGAGKLTAYFHVRTFLSFTYDHGQYDDVSLDKAEGSRVLVREAWDNAGGQSGKNYDLPLESR